MTTATAESHPTLAETASRAWNRLPSLWKVLIPAIGGLLLMLVPATLLIGSRIYAVTTDNLRAQHRAFLTDVGSNFEDFLNRHAAYVAGLAESEPLKACAKLETGCTEQAQAVFGTELGRKISDPSGYYTEIGFIDNSFKETARAVRGSGNVVTITNTVPPIKINADALKALPDGQVYVFPISRDTRLAISEPYQHPLLRMAAPVSVDGKQEGYVTAALNLDDFFAQNFVFSDQQQSFLLDSEGCLLASSDDSARTELYKTWNGDPDRPCYKDLQLQDWDTTVQRYHDTVLSTRALHGVLSNSGQTWTIVVQQPTAKAYAEANNLQALLAFAHIITTLFVAGLIVAADRATAQLIRAAQMRNVAHARDIRFNPYVVGGPVEDRRLFFGRTKALAQVIGAGVMGGDDVLIDGDRQIGKTSLLRQVERRLHDRRVSDPTYWYWPVSLSLQGVSAEVFHATLMDHILRDIENHETRLKLRYHAGHSSYSADDFREDLARVLDLPNGTDRQTRMVLCLDNIHVWLGGAEGYDPKFIEKFRDTLTVIGNQLKLIATGLHVPENAFDRTMNIVTLGPLERDEAERLIRQPVAEYYTYSDEAVNTILEYSDRLPMELQRLCHHAVQAMLEADAASISAAHAERALQRAIGTWEPTYRLLWNGGLDKAGKQIERFSDELREKLLELAGNNAPIPAELMAGENPVLSRARLNEISYTDEDGSVWLTSLFKAWLKRTLG